MVIVDEKADSELRSQFSEMSIHLPGAKEDQVTLSTPSEVSSESYDEKVRVIYL